MRRVIAFAAVAGFAFAACSSAEEAKIEPNASATETSQTVLADQPVDDTAAATTTTTTTTTNPPALDPITEDDLVRFIAATEAVLQGTEQEGVVYGSPEIYIAIAQAACARFSAGDDFDEIADDLLAEFAEAGLEGEERLVGAILGAATKTICPEHADKISA